MLVSLWSFVFDLHVHRNELPSSESRISMRYVETYGEGSGKSFTLTEENMWKVA